MWILKHKYEGYHIGNLQILLGILILLFFNSPYLHIIGLII